MAFLLGRQTKHMKNAPCANAQGAFKKDVTFLFRVRPTFKPCRRGCYYLILAREKTRVKGVGALAPTSVFVSCLVIHTEAHHVISVIAPVMVKCIRLEFLPVVDFVVCAEICDKGHCGISV